MTRLVAPGPEVARQTPGLAGGPGIAVGHVSGALLVAYQNVVYARIDQVIIDGQCLPSGITEHHVHALPFEQR